MVITKRVFHLCFLTVRIGKKIVSHCHRVIFLQYKTRILEPDTFPWLQCKTLVLGVFIISADKIGNRAFYS